MKGRVKGCSLRATVKVSLVYSLFFYGDVRDAVPRGRTRLCLHKRFFLRRVQLWPLEVELLSVSLAPTSYGVGAFLL